MTGDVDITVTGTTGIPYAVALAVDQLAAAITANPGWGDWTIRTLTAAPAEGDG